MGLATDLDEATAETALAELAAAGHTDKVRATRVDVAEEAD